MQKWTSRGYLEPEVLNPHIKCSNPLLRTESPLCTSSTCHVSRPTSSKWTDAGCVELLLSKLTLHQSQELAPVTSHQDQFFMSFVVPQRICKGLRAEVHVQILAQETQACTFWKLTFTRLHGPFKHRGTKLQTSSCRTISLRLSRSMWSSRTLGNLGVKLDPLCERFRGFNLCLARSNLKWLQVRKIPVWDYRNDRDAKSYWESCSCSMLGRSTNLILLDLGPELQRCSRWNTMASDNKS